MYIYILNMKNKIIIITGNKGAILRFDNKNNMTPRLIQFEAKQINKVEEEIHFR